METVAPPLEHPEVNNEQVQRVANELATLVFLSFRFSQGFSGIQEKLLTLVAETTRNSLSPLNTSTPVVDLAADKLAGMCSGFVMSGNHKEIEDGPRTIHGQYIETANEYITLESRRRLDYYLDALNSGGEDFIFGSVLTDIIGMDRKFIREEQGRPSGENSDGSMIRSEKDRFASHFVKYVLLGMPTSSEVYDQVFTKLREKFQATYTDLIRIINIVFYEGVLEHVINRHLAANPEDLEPLSQHWPDLVPQTAGVE